MKIAFFGLPLAAILLHHDGHDVVHAGICRKDAPGTRRLARLLGAGRISIVPDLADAGIQRAITLPDPELLVSWFWVKNIPSALRARFPLGAVGVHPSLLPRHRGPDPCFWAIERGDLVTGVTAHELDDAYDTGRILGQRELAIDPEWNAWTLAKRLDRPSLALLRDVVRAFAEGSPPDPRAQDESRATLAPAVDEDLLELDWTRPADEILRTIRAAAPWPGAYTFLGDDVVTVTRARRAEGFPRALRVGEGAVVRAPGGAMAVVRAADAGVEILAGRSSDDAPLDRGEIAEKMEKAGSLR